jgi:nucleotide-binding universal stress UspA family protein
MKKKRDERPIVCGTDFSAMAMEAADIAAAMARRLGTKLVLAHADDFGTREVLAMPYEVALTWKRKALEREANRLRRSGTVVEKKLLIGSALDELVTAGIKSKARLIVVGAIGHSMPRRLLVGSVAERTAEASPIPTLVVRPGAKFSSWIRGKHALKVLAGYDFSATSDAALRWVNQLQGLGRCKITVLYSSWPPDEWRRLGYQGPLPLSTDPREIQKKLERDLARRVANFLPGRNVTAIVEAAWGSPEGYLFQMASRRHVDLVVVGTHQRLGLGRVLLGSVSRAVLHHAKVTVAVVPPVKTVTRKQAP